MNLFLLTHATYLNIVPLAADGSIKLAAAMPKKEAWLRPAAPELFLSVIPPLPFPGIDALLALFSSKSSSSRWGSYFGSNISWEMSPAPPDPEDDAAKSIFDTDEVVAAVVAEAVAAGGALEPDEDDWGSVMSDSSLRFFAKSLMATSGSLRLPLSLFKRLRGMTVALKYQNYYKNFSLIKSHFCDESINLKFPLVWVILRTLPRLCRCTIGLGRCRGTDPKKGKRNEKVDFALVFDSLEI